jgi:hypothetical protein
VKCDCCSGGERGEEDGSGERERGDATRGIMCLSVGERRERWREGGRAGRRRREWSMR